MRTRTHIELARRRAAWLSLVATLLGAAVVPGLHVGVHAVELLHEHEHQHEHRGDGRPPAPRPRHGHASAHGHRHVGVGHHGPHVAVRDDDRAAEPAPPRDHHRHHHHGGGEDRDPTQHGRGAPEHLDDALLESAAPLHPPRPIAVTQLRAAVSFTGRVVTVVRRPNAIRGPPPASFST